MMLDILIIVSLLIVLVLAALPILFTIRLQRFIKDEMIKQPESGFGRVALILPLKGLDPGFKENIQAILSQDYTDCDYYFVTATTDDPAYVALSQILPQYPQCNTYLLCAGIVPYRAQKITNQLAAVDAVGSSADILVFVDSDIRPEPDFIRYLISPLTDAKIGASTGFRWYLPIRGGFGSYLRSTWNAGGLPFLLDTRHNFVWGGAMAVTRLKYEECEVRHSWDKALSDDFGLTRAIKSHGYSIRFVPQCLAISHEDSTLSETLEWTNRQTIIARIYSLPFWLTVGIVHGLLNLFVFLGLFLFTKEIAFGSQTTIIFLGGVLLLLTLECLNAMLLVSAVLPMLRDYASDVKKNRWIYIFIAPIASLLILWNTIYSAFTSKITWRGVTYEIVSPYETRVIQKNKI